MPKVAVDYDGDEVIIGLKSKYSFILKEKQAALRKGIYAAHILSKGSIEKLIGRKLTWEDDPVELKEE
jgi:hypothetical protein